MKKFKLLSIFVLFFSSVVVSQTVNPVAESKRNICLLNHEVIQGVAQSTVGNFGFQKAFSAQNINAAHYSSSTYNEAVFVDNYHKRLLIASNNNAFNTPQYNSFYPVFANSSYTFGNSAVADLNNNNINDIVTSNSRGDVYLHRGVGLLIHITDSLVSTLGSSGRNGRVYLAHANTGNALDIVSIGSHTTMPFGYYYNVFNNQSTSSALIFNSVTTGVTSTFTTPPNDNFSAAPYDLNGDGKDEVLFISETTSSSLTVICSLLTGTLNYVAQIPLTTSSLVVNKKVTAGDYNKDNQPDIGLLGTIPSLSLSYVYIYSPTFVSGIPSGVNQQAFLTIPYNVNDVVFVDVNQDSLKDIVVNVANTGSVIIYPQSKVGSAMNFTLEPFTIFNQGLHTSGGLATFDVDFNKMSDIISFNTKNFGNNIDTSSISILKNFTYRDTLVATPSKTTLCPGESIVLQNTIKGYSYIYQSSYSPVLPGFPASHTLNVSSPGFYSSSVTYSTLITFPVSASTCFATSNTIQIAQGIVPTLTINAPEDLCIGNTASISITGLVTSVNSYTWSTGEVNVPFISVSPTVSLFHYFVVAKSIDGCSTYALDSINTHPNTVANATYDHNFLCRNEKSVLSASGGSTYIWSTGQTVPTITVTQTTTGPQTYTVIVDNGFGCSDTATIQTIFNDKCGEVVIKTGITPNGDGNNDFFYVENIDRYPENQVSIFNRWGVELYTVKGYDNSTKVWPIANSAKLTAGTYFYVIDLGNGDPLRKGWLEILNN